MINHLQNGLILTIGPFEILNWETAALVGRKHIKTFIIVESFSFNSVFLVFLQLTRRVYSFFMFLFNF